MHELFFCAKADVNSRSITAIRRMIRADRRAIMPASRLELICRSVCIMSRDVSEDCHPHNKQKGHNADQVEYQCSSLILWRTVHEWHDEQEQGDNVEGHDANHFAVESPNLGRQQLQCLKHEQEIPLRLDACRRRRKRVSFFAQLPGKESGKRCQRSEEHTSELQ